MLELKMSDRYVILSNVSICSTSIITKKSYNNNKFEISGDLKFSVYYQRREALKNNPPIRRFVSKIQNRIKLRIKTGYYLKFLMPQTMKLLGSIKNKITKDQNCDNKPHLKCTEVVLVHFIIININRIKRSYIHLFLINCLVNY